MKVLGVDPSLTAFGWAVHDTTPDVGSPSRCLKRGRFSTPARMEFVERYVTMRESLRALVRQESPDAVGIEHPVFASLYSEGMYGLFLYTCEALKAERCDVVFWSPLQVKAHARDSLGRPPKWQMMKPDMVEAAKADTGGKGTWNHNEADAYLVGRLAGRFWAFIDGGLPEADLTTTERKYFAGVRTLTRGNRAGEVVRSGVMYREDERFFRWSTTYTAGDGGSDGGGDNGGGEEEEGGRDDGRPRGGQEDIQD